MRPSIISAFATFFLLSAIQTTVASPLVLSSLQLEEGNALEKRCANPCGADSQLCCGSSEACYTNSLNQAACSETGSGGEWQYYTTTYTETDTSTITSVWSSRITSAAVATSTSGTCQAEFGETTCGTSCCSADEECVQGECVAESSSAAVTGEATPAARGTSSGWVTATATASATTTEGFIAPVSTDGSDLIGAKATDSGGGGLSGGAIAGIVIGVIAGVVLLLVLCAWLCLKGLFDGLLACLGIGGRKRRKQETIIDERYSHHSHGSRPRPQGGRTWFGTKPAASEVSEKKKSGWSGWGTAAIILGALALCLGLRRHKDRDNEDDRTTSYTYPSTYYYSDYTRIQGEQGTLDDLDEREIHVHDVHDEWT
ncbi:hypothetical protein N7478_006336 [Penicillium angulare]|uniref:uncharacterized protein n=1 Tax=Penicillium angulare TaxID=116970 RepID=UPI002542170E|nr:uncharacterized protein N7478_006336 [Penicillium angulare]KAJ5280964.1 hypothetical protein N7478_006336 [Penicillium angulare]